MRSINVLLTCVGGYFSLTVIHALRKSKDLQVRIIGADADPGVFTRYYVDVFHPVPLGDSLDYPSRLLEICRKEKVHVILPGSDEEALSLSRHKAVFESEGIHCAVDDYDHVELLVDKWRLYEALQKIGVRVPRFAKADSAEEITGLAKEYGYPKYRVAIKPRSGRGSRGVFILGTDTGSITLKAFLEQCSDPNDMNSMIMEYISGNAYDIDVVCYKGITHCIVPRLRCYKNPLSNFSEGHRVVDHPEIFRMVKKVVRELHLSGPFDFDCGSFDDGTPTLYEINPRLSGSTVVSLGAGVNVPLILLNMMIGLPIPEPQISFGVRMYPKHDMIFEHEGRIFTLD